jgi:hypothetical protein
MPIKNDKFVYSTGFKPPYQYLAYDGQDFYLLPRQVGKKFMGLRKASVSVVNGSRKVLYGGKRINLTKLVTEFRVDYKTEKEVMI